MLIIFDLETTFFIFLFVPSGRRESPDGFLIPSNKVELNLSFIGNPFPYLLRIFVVILNCENLYPMRFCVSGFFVDLL